MNPCIMYILSAILVVCGLVQLLGYSTVRDKIFAFTMCAIAIVGAYLGWFFSDTRIIASDLKESYGPEVLCRKCLERHPIDRIESEKMEESEYTGYNWIARIFQRPTGKCKFEEPTVIKLEYEWPCVLGSTFFDIYDSRRDHEEDKCPDGMSEADSNKYTKVARDYKGFIDGLAAEVEGKWDDADAKLQHLLEGTTLPDTNAVAKIVRELREAERKEATEGCEAATAATNCPVWFIRHEFFLDGDIRMRVMMERIRQLSNLEYAILPRMDAERAKVHYARYRAGAVYIRAVKDGVDETSAKKAAKAFLTSLEESK